MSLVNLAHVCSHLQNASKARLGMTSIPYTKLHATLSQQLMKQGFISNVTVGGPEPPSGESSPILGTNHASPEESVVTQQNISSRRLWLGMKYWNNKPVLTKMSLISKPTRRIWARNEDLAKIMRGQQAGYVRGMREIGEAIFVSTDRGIMELRECVEKGIGGQLLVRVW